MKNIVKAQLYQLKKERLLYIVFVLCCILSGIAIMNAEGDCFGERMCGVASTLPQISLAFLFTAVAVICGRDFMDKTGNYELMTGHTRAEMYAGRAMPAIVVGVVGSMLICVFVFGAGCLWLGFGDAVSLKTVLTRMGLMVFPMFRLACEMVFLTFIIRNTYAVMAVGYVYVFFITELLLGISEQPSSYYLGMTNLVKLWDLTAFQTYSPAHPSLVMTVYDAAIGLADVGATILVSLTAGIIFLILGYHFFKTDDIE